MTRWPRGEDDIATALRVGQLQSVAGAQADGRPWLEKAERTLVTAAAVLEVDGDSAYVLAYDAARYACTALLAQQGLRATTAGGHYAVERAVRAQFGDGFKPFATLRRRRNELEYPLDPSAGSQPREAADAIE